MVKWKEEQEEQSKSEFSKIKSTNYYQSDNSKTTNQLSSWKAQIETSFFLVQIEKRFWETQKD